MRRTVSILCCLMATLLLGTTTAQAAPILWTLSNVNFDDGGMAFGSFTYDADLNLFSDIAVTTTDGTTRSGASYGIATGVGNASLFDTVDSLPVIVGVTPRLIFNLTNPMTNLGGTIAIGGQFAVEVTCASPDCGTPSNERFIVSGAITSVPEPTSMLLLGIGAASIVVRRRTGR